MRSVFIATLIGALGLTIVTLAMGTAALADDQEVAVDDFYFCDGSFENGVCATTIMAGDTITWSVEGGFHTVTECDGSFATCPPAGGFDSGQLTVGAQFQQTFDTAGTFYYRCDNHPTQMRGTVTVEAAQDTPTPTPQPTGSQTPAASDAASPTASVAASPAGVPTTGAAGSGGQANGVLIAVIGALATAGAAIAVLRALRRDEPSP